LFTTFQRDVIIEKEGDEFMKKLIFITILCAFLTIPALGDFYGTVQLNETTPSPTLQGTIYSNYSTGAYNLQNGLNVYIGKYNWQLGTYNLESDAGFTSVNTWGFCIEMQLSDGWQPYNIVDVQDAPIDHGPDGPTVGMGDAKADYIRELWTAHIDETNTALGAAAFQAAVWEIVYEDAEAWDVGSWDETFSDSTFGTTNTTIANKANEWLQHILENDYALTTNILALSNEDWQDYIVQIPVPAAVLLGILGLGVAGLKLRRFA
jgi:hypothetical protein